MQLMLAEDRIAHSAGKGPFHQLGLAADEAFQYWYAPLLPGRDRAPGALRAGRRQGHLSHLPGKIAMLRHVARRGQGRAGWLAGAAVYCAGLAALAQVPMDGPASRPASMPLAAPTAGPLGPGQLVVDVLIRGDHTTKDYEIQKYIHTRRDREFDSDILQGDVRRLVASGLFKDV